MNVKKMLQAPLRSRQRAKYEARIKEQTVRYHDWIVKKEEKEREARGTDARQTSGLPSACGQFSIGRGMALKSATSTFPFRTTMGAACSSIVRP